jgi:hypothetical protein
MRNDTPLCVQNARMSNTAQRAGRNPGRVSIQRNFLLRGRRVRSSGPPFFQRRVVRKNGPPCDPGLAARRTVSLGGYAASVAWELATAMKRSICCFNCASTSSAMVTTAGSTSSNCKCFWLRCSIEKMVTCGRGPLNFKRGQFLGLGSLKRARSVENGVD